MFSHQKHVPRSNLERHLPSFLLYLKGERGYSPETLVKSQDCIRQIAKLLGSFDVQQITKDQIRELKAAITEKNQSISRMHSLLLMLRSYLLFCRDELGLALLLD